MDRTGFDSIKAEIIIIGRQLLKKGLVTGTWGNISARVPATGYIAITPSGRDYKSLSTGEIVILDPDGNIVEGGVPSSETPLHLAVYKSRTDIKAVVHTHSVFASACAVARRPIPPVIEDLVQLVGGQVDVAEYALPGSADLARNAAQALGDRQAVLLANHGIVGCGATLREALTACELVEKAAQIYLHAIQLGGAHVLSDEDVAIMRRFYLNKYRGRREE